jgi:hypothetical protein
MRLTNVVTSTYRALREITVYLEDYWSMSMDMSMPPSPDAIDTSLSTSPRLPAPEDAATAVPTSLSPSVSLSSAPLPLATLELDGNSDTVVSGIEGDTSSASGVTSGQTALIVLAMIALVVLVVYAAALARLLVLRWCPVMPSSSVPDTISFVSDDAH